jgi:hypothetical protein
MTNIVSRLTSAGDQQLQFFESDEYRVVGRPPTPPAEPAEVYRVLAAIQAQLPRWQTLSIDSNPRLRVPGLTFKPDLSVMYRGRAGVIAIDGGSHDGRYCADRSRDRLLEDAGIAFVDRLSAEDANVASESETFVNRFLGRLCRS